MEQGLERLVVSIFLMGVFIATGKAWGALARRALGNRSHAGAIVNLGSPTLLYFWSMDCASCAVQERHIEEAREVLEKGGRRLEVRKVNALEETALTRSMKVLTVPTTVLLDRRGNVLAWNPGLRPAQTIVSQVEAAAS
jgi:thioredoxin-like negative regulator of GroEL